MAIITALMTTFNSAIHVRETLESILNQTFDDFEFLIVDDGSTDDTTSIIKSYHDKRIRLIEKHENKGVGTRLSEALLLIRTPYIAKVDSDDISNPGRFEKQLRYLQANPHMDIIKSWFEYFPDNSNVAQSERYKYFKGIKEKEHNAIDTPELIKEHLPRWNCIIHTTYFAKTDVIKAIGYPDQRIGEDYSLFYRALEAGYVIGCIQEKLTRMRISHISVTTRTESADHFSALIVRLKKNKIDALHAIHEGFWIYGTGNLGKALYWALIKNGYRIKGFLEREKKSDLIFDNQSLPIESIFSIKDKGILIAAQPVRTEIRQLLLGQELTEWKDFMVIA